MPESLDNSHLSRFNFVLSQRGTASAEVKLIDLALHASETRRYVH